MRRYDRLSKKVTIKYFFDKSCIQVYNDVRSKSSALWQMLPPYMSFLLLYLCLRSRKDEACFFSPWLQGLSCVQKYAVLCRGEGIQ